MRVLRAITLLMLTFCGSMTIAGSQDRDGCWLADYYLKDMGLSTAKGALVIGRGMVLPPEFAAIARAQLEPPRSTRRDGETPTSISTRRTTRSAA